MLSVGKLYSANCRMRDELEIISEGSGRGLFEVLSRYLLEGTEENYEKLSQGEVRTEYHMNTSLDLPLYTPSR
jgi:hypothetical protein